MKWPSIIWPNLHGFSFQILSIPVRPIFYWSPNLCVVLISLSGKERQVREEVQVSMWNLFSGGLLGGPPNSGDRRHGPVPWPLLGTTRRLHAAAATPELHSEDFQCYKFWPFPCTISILLSCMCSEICNNLKPVKNLWVLNNNSSSNNYNNWSNHLQLPCGWRTR